MTQASQALIELRNVTKAFTDSPPAVDNVSFSVATEKTTCLIGMSGSGKTTVLKMINHLVEPTHGDILIKGENIYSKDPITLRRSMGYVIQKGGLMPHLTVLENICLLEKIKGTPKKEYIEEGEALMELMHLDPAAFADRYPLELSGGQQQRVGIARALMGNPPILLMDEPFGALDPNTRKHLQDEFIEINSRLRKTIIFVTHSLSEAFQLGHHIVMMDKGKIAQQGTSDAFLKKPESAFVTEFLNSYLEGVVT